MPQPGASRIHPSYETQPWHCKTISAGHSLSRASFGDTISINYHGNISPRKLYQVLSGNTSGGWYPDPDAGSSAGHELSLREPDVDWRPEQTRSRPAPVRAAGKVAPVHCGHWQGHQPRHHPARGHQDKYQFTIISIMGLKHSIRD